MLNKTIVSFGIVLTLMVTLGAVAIPNYAHAQIGVGPAGGGGGIKNPLGDGGSETITDVLKRIINWMLGLVGFLALIALIIGGAQMIMDFGNEDRVQKAKVTITWAVIGLAVVILSYAIINIVTSNILGAG